MGVVRNGWFLDIFQKNLQVLGCTISEKGVKVDT